MVAAGGFIVVFALFVPLEQSWRSWTLRAYGTAIFVAILVQGAVWWRGRLRDLQARLPRPDAAELRVFDRLRGINWILLAAFPLLVAWMRAISGPIPPADLGWGLALAFCAVIEQVNYYHHQLSYGYGLDFWYLRRNRRLRRGNIARYLDAAVHAGATVDRAYNPRQEGAD